MTGIQRVCLSVAGMTLEVQTDRCFDIKGRFLPFLTETNVPDFQACFRKVDRLGDIPKRVLHRDRNYAVYPGPEDGFIRTFWNEPRDQVVYGLGCYDFRRGHVQVEYLEEGKQCVSEMHNSFFHLDFEGMLIRRGRICFHAACVQTPLGGILFSGTSGIGKSTQAKLWCQYREAKQINGDRPILSKDGAGWLAWGSPYAGSSGVHINESCPVTAIIMLRQEARCSLRRLTKPEAFRAVWSGLTVHSWDPEFVDKASTMALELIETVPVFEFGCTPDEAAVDYLENALRKECGL